MSILVQSASLALASLRKRLDAYNASVRAFDGNLGEFANLSEEEALVRKLVEERASLLNRLRMMWSAANKHVSDASQWCEETLQVIADLPLETAVGMSACSENLGQVQVCVGHVGMQSKDLGFDEQCNQQNSEKVNFCTA